MDTAEEIQHDEFELDEASQEHVRAYPNAHGGSFKDGALWMLDWIKKSGQLEKHSQSHTNEVLDTLEKRVKEMVIIAGGGDMGEYLDREDVLNLIQDLKQ